MLKLSKTQNETIQKSNKKFRVKFYQKIKSGERDY